MRIKCSDHDNYRVQIFIKKITIIEHSSIIPILKSQIPRGACHPCGRLLVTHLEQYFVGGEPRLLVMIEVGLVLAPYGVHAPYGANTSGPYFSMI